MSTSTSYKPASPRQCGLWNDTGYTETSRADERRCLVRFKVTGTAVSCIRCHATPGGGSAY